MANEQATITIKVKDIASADLKKIASALEDVANGEQEAAQGATDNTTATSAMGKASSLAGAAIGATTAVVAAAAAGVVALTKAMLAATDVADGYQFAEAQVDAAVRRVAKDTAEAAKMKMQLLKVSQDLATATGAEVTEVQKITARYVQMGISVERAGKLASLAYDISARTGKDATEAAQKLAEVVRSNTGSFAELTDATKSEEEALDKMTSKTAKAERMIGILEERFGGAKSEIQGTQIATNNLSNAKQGLIAEIGKVIDESKLFSLVLSPLTAQINRMAKYVRDNKTALMDMALVLGTNVVKAGGLAAKVVTGVATAARLVAVGIKVLAVSSEIAWNNMLNVVSTVSQAIQGFMLKMVEGLQTTLTNMREMAEALGQDRIAASLRRAEAAVGGLINAQKKGIATLADGDKKRAESNKELVKSLVDLGKETETVIQQGADAYVKIDTVMENTVNNIRRARAEIAKAPAASATQDLTGQNKKQAKLSQDALKLDEKKKALLASQAKLLDLRTKLLSTTNQEEQINLDYQIKVMEAKNAAAQIDDAALAQATLRNGLKKAEIEKERALLDLNTKRGEKAKEQFLSELERQALARKEREAAVQETVAGIMSVANSFDVMGSSSNAAIAKAGKGLKSLTSAIGDLYKVNQLNNQKTAEGAKLTAGAYASIGEGVASLAGSMGASAILQAAILAPFNLAAGLAASANPATAAQAPFYYAAAAQYAVVAGMSAAGVGGKGGSGGSGGAAGTSATPPAPSENAKQAAEVFAETFAEKTGGGGGQTIIFDMRGSMVLDENKLFDQVNNSARAEGLDLRRSR